MTLKDIQKDVDSYDWPAILAAAKQEPQDDEGGNTVGYCYLGTVFNLTPSGKYYMPFACSNVDACPSCKGKGTLPNGKHNKYTYDLARSIRRIITQTGFRFYGIASEWPNALLRFALKMDTVQAKRDITVACKYCNSMGSREAYLDDVWNDAMEDAANAVGGFITGGEGDPCDILFGIVLEDEVTGDEHD